MYKSNNSNIFYKSKFLLKTIILTILVIVLFYSTNKVLDKKNFFDIAKHNFHSCEHNNFNPVWLVTYGAGDVHQVNQKALVISSIDKCIDYIKNYTPETLSHDFIIKNKEILNQKRGAGYWLWKPYIILETLKQAPKNDLVIYIDSGLIVKKPLDILINQLGEFDMMAFNNTHTNLPYIKNDLFIEMNMDNDYARNHLQYDGSILIMRNTERTQKFIENWLSWSKNNHAISDTPSTTRERPEFIDHRHDQAIMSLLLLDKEKNVKFLPLPINLKQDFFHHHRRRLLTESLEILQ